MKILKQSRTFLAFTISVIENAFNSAAQFAKALK
jgi:hypothetical protein